MDLLCGNKRCISIQLMCDSFDNCGDNSDEAGDCKPGMCYLEIGSPVVCLQFTTLVVLPIIIFIIIIFII